MRLDDLMEYDKIVGWGAGQGFEDYYKKRIHLDYIVDKDEDKIGTCIYGIPVYPISTLEEEDKNKKILIIIFSPKYQEEIIDEICKLGIYCDYIGVGEYIYLFDISRNKYFAGYAVDANVIEMLRISKYKIDEMSYIEVGAADPVFGSATYLMYLKGARGVLVEPNPDYISRIKRLRSEDTCINCGIGNANEVLKFYRLDNPYRNSFDINCVNENIAKGFKLVDELDIELKTLETVIEESGLDTSKTYLTFQVMGLEYDVLSKFEYSKYKFPIIQVAYHDERVRELNIFKDYFEIVKLPWHSILVNKEIYNCVFERCGYKSI